MSLWTFIMCEVETVSESLKVYFLVDGSTVVKKKNRNSKNMVVKVFWSQTSN